MTMNDSLSKTIDDVIEWSDERELTTKGTLEGQKIKTMEEMAELIKAMSKDDIKDVKDAVGDVVVTVIVGMLLSPKNTPDVKQDIQTILKKASQGKKHITNANTKPQLMAWFGRLIYQCPKSAYIDWFVEDTFYFLNRVCDMYSLTLGDCLKSAYEEIKNRKGKIIDGTFVKEGDLAVTGND